MLRSEYELLQAKYSKLLLSTLEFSKQISASVQQNIHMLKHITEFDYCVLKKLKNLILCFTLTFNHLNVNEVCQSFIVDVDMSQQYRDRNQYHEFLSSRLNTYIQDTLLEHYNFEHFSKSILTNAINNLNEKYFNMDAKSFFSLVLRYIIDNENMPELENYKNFMVLSNIKQTYDMICEYALKNYVDQKAESAPCVSQSMFQLNNCANVPSVKLNEQRCTFVSKDDLLKSVGTCLFSLIAELDN